jgi:hypothetical protein
MCDACDIPTKPLSEEDLSLFLPRTGPRDYNSKYCKKINEMLQGMSRGYIIKSSREGEKKYAMYITEFWMCWLGRYYEEKGGWVEEGYVCVWVVFFF